MIDLCVERVGEMKGGSVVYGQMGFQQKLKWKDEQTWETQHRSQSFLLLLRPPLIFLALGHRQHPKHHNQHHQRKLRHKVQPLHKLPAKLTLQNHKIGRIVTELKTHQQSQKYGPHPPSSPVPSADHRIPSVEVLEHQPLQVQLAEPQHLRYVVGRIEPVPEGADHEDVELVGDLALEGRPLVHRFSQPFLHADVPGIDLVPHVDAGLEGVGVDRVDAGEVVAVEAGPRGVDCCEAQLPAEVVFAADEVDGCGGVEEDVPGGLKVEGVGFEGGDGEVVVPQEVQGAEEDGFPESPKCHPRNRRNRAIDLPPLYVIFIVVVLQGRADERRGQEVQVPHKLPEAHLPGHPIPPLLLRQPPLVLPPVLQIVRQQRILADQDHQQSRGAHGPPSVVREIFVDVVGGEEEHGLEGDQRAAPPPLESDHRKNDEMLDVDGQHMPAVDHQLQQKPPHRGVELPHAAGLDALEEVGEGEEGEQAEAESQ